MIVRPILVARPIDHGKAGTGQVYSEGKTLKGQNTKFLTELKRPSVNDFCLKEAVATIYIYIYNEI